MALSAWFRPTGDFRVLLSSSPGATIAEADALAAYINNGCGDVTSRAHQWIDEDLAMWAEPAAALPLLFQPLRSR